VGLPISAALGFATDLGPRGLWWGLTVGLILVALVLVRRVRWRLGGAVARVIIDHEAASISPGVTPSA